MHFLKIRFNKSVTDLTDFTDTSIFEQNILQNTIQRLQCAITMLNYLIIAR